MSGGNRGMAVRVMQKLKQEGLQKGFPDIIVLLEDKVLVIEMKRVKGGKVSEDQKRWQRILKRYPHIEASVCAGCDEAIEFVKENL